MDEVVAIIRGSADVDTARTNLMTQLTLSQVQAQAILDMQLRRLAALEREKLEDEHKELLQTIAELEDLLSSPAKILAKVQDETRQIKKDFGDARRTVIYEEELGADLEEDRIAHDDVVITLSQRGYIKRMPADTYRTQHRGGKGRSGMSTKEEDAVTRVFSASTPSPMRPSEPISQIRVRPRSSTLPASTPSRTPC